MRMSSSHPAAAVLAEVLAEEGVKHAVVSPGSRNAPIVLALHHHPDIEVRVSIDERSAAHHALGLALATWTPVPVVCTSGTAALNHGPALAEAFHARIPLLSITADRPSDVVGRGHGQTVVQTNVHAPHTVHSDVLDATHSDPVDLTQRVRHAMHMARCGGAGNSPGPVHLNVPLEEPLYDLAEAPALVGRETEEEPLKTESTSQIPDRLREAILRGKAIVLAGPRPHAAHQMEENRLEVNLPCLAERGACVKGPLVVHGAERLLQHGSWPDELQPEAIVTIGLPPMSKALRNALSNLPHWHVGADLEGEGGGWDIWNTLKGDVPASTLQMHPNSDAMSPWVQAQLRLESTHQAFVSQWSDLQAWQTVSDTWQTWPEHQRPKSLHIANSASARYAQWVDLDGALTNNAAVHANRGVAGIDGCTSTAVGWTSVQRDPNRHWLITGDLAFLYDANAMLTDPNSSKPNIVVMNNGGGGIFRWLPGTQHHDMFERHFETPPNRTVKQQAEAMNATCLTATNAKELADALAQAISTPSFVVVDVQTPSSQSAQECERYLNAFQTK